MGSITASYSDSVRMFADYGEDVWDAPLAERVTVLEPKVSSLESDVNALQEAAFDGDSLSQQALDRIDDMEWEDVTFTVDPNYPRLYDLPAYTSTQTFYATGAHGTNSWTAIITAKVGATNKQIVCYAACSKGWHYITVALGSTKSVFHLVDEAIGVSLLSLKKRNIPL